MQPLRQLEPGFDRNALRRERAMTLLLVAGSSSWFATTMCGKDELIAKWRSDGGRLMLAWNGQWRSDVFELSSTDIEAAFPPVKTP
jgi:hypothetical protein